MLAAIFGIRGELMPKNVADVFNALLPTVAKADFPYDAGPSDTAFFEEGSSLTPSNMGIKFR
jgi:hypothetical protein